MKKILIGLLSGVMIFSLVACGGTETPKKEETKEETQVEETKTEENEYERKDVTIVGLENYKTVEVYNTKLGSTELDVDAGIKESTPVKELEELREVVLKTINIQEVKENYSEITFKSFVNDDRVLLITYKRKNKEFIPDVNLNSEIYKEAAKHI